MQSYIIETEHLTKQYDTRTVVSNVSLHVRQGRIYGLLGRNGAGKTTIMKLLLGLIRPTAGQVQLWGESLPQNETKLLPHIGSLIESPGFYPNLTGSENLRIFATLRGMRRAKREHAIHDALELVGLPYDDKRLFSQYSLGMKQRLAIALVVLHDPDLLILDEPMNGLDPIGITTLRALLRELCTIRGKTILISSHILAEISLLADDIGILDHGVLLEEESLASLEQKSERYIQLEVSDTAQAARILTDVLQERRFSIQDEHHLQLYNQLVSSQLVKGNLPTGDTQSVDRVPLAEAPSICCPPSPYSVADIITALVQNGVAVQQAYTHVEQLEDYFKRVTGGKGIA